MTTASAHRSVRLCALLILICAAALLLPWGRSALGAETDESPCMLTDEQRAAYEADGTLDARIAYQESLRNDRPSEGLISQAMERERAAQGIGAYAVPSNWSSGMASVGAAHVLGLRITFPTTNSKKTTRLTRSNPSSDLKRKTQPFLPEPPPFFPMKASAPIITGLHMESFPLRARRLTTPPNTNVITTRTTPSPSWPKRSQRLTRAKTCPDSTPTRTASSMPSTSTSRVPIRDGGLSGGATKAQRATRRFTRTAPSAFGTWSCWQKTPATPGPPAPLFTKQATCSDCPTITARKARRGKVPITPAS